MGKKNRNVGWKSKSSKWSRRVRPKVKLVKTLEEILLERFRIAEKITSENYVQIEFMKFQNTDYLYVRYDESEPTKSCYTAQEVKQAMETIPKYGITAEEVSGYGIISYVFSKDVKRKGSW